MHIFWFAFVAVFFHLCYEGAVDLDTIRDINDRHGLEVQIMEFGQIPKQVFTLPHPKRLTSVSNLLHSETLLTSSETTTSGVHCIVHYFLSIATHARACLYICTRYDVD